MTGKVFTRCAECGKLFKVEVEFPHWNAGFTPTVCNCPNCGTELKVTDNHVYNPETGEILEEVES